MRWCPRCGRPMDLHSVKRQLTVTGMRRVRICPVEREPGFSNASSVPPPYRPERDRM
jgi:hypothetical protein